jgi:hypothetical protein
VEAEFAGGVELPQSSHKLPSKHPAEDAHRQEEPGARRNPPGVVGRQPSCRNYAMDMRMMQQFLIPGVQHAEEAEFRPEVSFVASYRQQRLGAGLKQQAVDLALVSVRPAVPVGASCPGRVNTTCA